MNNRYRCFFHIIFAALLVFNSCSKAKTAAEPSRTEFVIGTVCSITLYDQGTDKIYKDVFDRLREIESRMSVNLTDSDVSRVNRAAGLEPVQVHEDVFKVIERALHFAELSDGAFDPTVEPLVAIWGIGGDNPRLPSQGEIDAVLPLINWRDVEINRENSTVFLKRQGMALDLGAIAKGYAADEAAAIIKKAGLRQAIVDLGGNILTVGEKKDKSPWRVGLQNPLESRGSFFGIVTGTEKAIVTSGVYERNFEANGVLYHHIFSSADGYPVRNGLLSVSIITGNSMDADALSTSVFVLGFEKGLALIESLPDTELVFVFDDKSVWKTGEVDFRITDDSFRLIGD